ALQVYTREAFPEQWAMAQNNLANAYRDRIRGERAENLERAIQTYQQALQVRTREAFPTNWAATQNNLAVAYHDRIRGERAENLEQALAASELALQVYTREAFPEQWAMTQHNLANAYSDRIRGERAENLEQALAASELALQVFTRETFPTDWAMTQNNLALAYGDRIRGERAENLEQAIQAYQFSLEVYRPDAFPRDSRRAARGLGDLYFAQQRWIEATAAYRQALQAAEILYQSASFFDNQAAELTATGDLHHRAAYALAQVGDLQTAVLTLEQGRARGLSDALARDRADLEQLQTTAPDRYDRYQQAAAQQRQIEDYQRALSARPAAERHGLRPDDLRQQLAQAHQELQNAIAAIRQIPGYADFLAPPDFAEIVSALPLARSVDPECGGEREEQGALVYLVTTEAGSLAIVVTASGDAIGNPTATIEPLWINDLSQDSLRKLLFGTPEAFGGWFGTYDQRETDGAAWRAAIDRGTAELGDGLMAPLSQHLTARGVRHAILIPTGYLGLLPLHAAWIPDPTVPSGRRYAFDRLYFSYAPNARSLKAAQAIARRTPPDSLLAIDEPTHNGADPLPHSQPEIDAAIATFSQQHQHLRLRHAQATAVAVRDALPHYAVWHFSCHGSANFADPLYSGLALANTDVLTLRDILALRLSGVRLAVLSACETGLPGAELLDEVVSLPAGLLQAGVAGVIASLWSVSDFSTMLLLTRFHDFWRIEGLAIDQALRRAQQWVRDTTNREKLVHFQGIEGACASVVSPEGARLLYGKLDDYDEPDRRSFAHPYHWAAFSYVGV
ncbi:MAG: CHAT domain-containing protein, partial [Candidatus Competibacteraceae bacterium]|nr:CHAT domain-containing protein [Candidatus Competibacteraceae bacterium]